MSLKEAYQEKADAQLREWGKRVDHMKNNPKVAHPEHHTIEQWTFERLEDFCHIAQLRLDELRTSRDERWEFAKQAVERAMIDLKRALDETGSGSANRIVKLHTGREHVYEPFQHKKNG